MLQVGRFGSLAWWTADRVAGPPLDLSKYGAIGDVPWELAPAVASAARLEGWLRKRYTRLNYGESKIVGVSDATRFAKSIETDLGSHRVVRLHFRAPFLLRAEKCHKCGYDLRGLENNLCPECGTLNSLWGLAPRKA